MSEETIAGGAPQSGTRSSARSLRRGSLLLLLPALVVFALFFLTPLATLVGQSFRLFVPGRVGSAADAPLTLENYTELLSPAYLSFFVDTFRIALVATLLALLFGFLIAYRLARMPARSPLRRSIISLLVTIMFLSVLIKVYAISLAFGPVGLLPAIARWLGLNPNSGGVIEILVVLGLLHYLIPIASLTLIGTIQNINPRLVEAAEVLGANRVTGHLSVTLPISLPGLISAGLICYTLCIGAFAIPMILGRGRILFVSNLIYSRFSQVSNFPSGAAISIVILVVSLVLVYLVTRLATPRRRAAQ